MAKAQTAISNVMAMLREWDKGSTSTRAQILSDFIKSSQNKTGPELEADFAQAASLFLARLTAWIRLTYMVGTCLSQQLQALSIFLSASSGHKFLAEFLDVGGVLTILEILSLKQAKEEDKAQALYLLMCIANSGRKYKELICESYGIRAVAECLARSKSEETQECARNMLQTLAQGNPKFESQVYKGLIALLPSSSPKAQQMAAQTLRIVQKIVRQANPNIVEPLVDLLKSYHLEVQFEAIELIKDLMSHDVQEQLLSSLVSALVPVKDKLLKRPEILDDPTAPELKRPLPVFVQQAAAGKVIGVLVREMREIAQKLIQKRCVHNLMIAMGNEDHADSQRQASITLEYLSSTFPIVDENIREAMGDALYQLFMANPEMLYMNMNAVQADVLRSNKVNIPGIVEGLE
ncbi:armadillo-like helical domain containing protein 1 [Asterias rubens]|uniref:armadillo-like helical domain containing protein 1 n=1 Tax=Asterias rubens TaxID=7604 RepID=UPI001454F0F1|nr:armadillo-like helical domain containing protein 1 [Asterias rubens]XP_033637133.1 armadillo-like helical domain containing protein 1 [Asterias rubens]